MDVVEHIPTPQAVWRHHEQVHDMQHRSCMSPAQLQQHEHAWALTPSVHMYTEVAVDAQQQNVWGLNMAAE